MEAREVIKIKEVRIGDKTYLGVEIAIPNSPPLVLIRGQEGFAMCGFLDIKAAEKANAMAARVPGVKSVEDMLDKEIAEVTSKAEARGIRAGMKLGDVLEAL